jgi:hypothetical protein
LFFKRRSFAVDRRTLGLCRESTLTVDGLAEYIKEASEDCLTHRNFHRSASVAHWCIATETVCRVERNTAHAAKPEVLELARECVEKVNADLSADVMLAGSQISRFLVLHKELDADDGELTRTRKVRRGYIGEKYEVLVDALYGGRKEQFIETAVKFEDGRSGSVSATIKIIDAKTLPSLRRAA